MKPSRSTRPPGWEEDRAQCRMNIDAAIAGVNLRQSDAIARVLASGDAILSSYFPTLAAVRNATSAASNAAASTFVACVA